MYVHIYVRIHNTYMYVCTYVHVQYIRTMYMYVHVHVHVRILSCTCTYMYIYTYMPACTCIMLFCTLCNEIYTCTTSFPPSFPLSLLSSSLPSLPSPLSLTLQEAVIKVWILILFFRRFKTTFSTSTAMVSLDIRSIHVQCTYIRTCTCISPSFLPLPPIPSPCTCTCIYFSLSPPSPSTKDTDYFCLSLS